MKPIFLFIAITLLLGCSTDKSDETLLKLDQQKLEENINYDKILFYKFAKIALRSAAVQDTTLAAYQDFSKHTHSIFKILNPSTPTDSGISIIEAIKLYQQYRKVKNLVRTTDEDKFPTLIDAYRVIYGHQKLDPYSPQQEEKVYVQNIEHAVLSVAALTTKELGQPVALYECTKTQPSLLADCEIKTLLEFVRGFLFFSNNLFYLSEDGLSSNISWLEKNKQVSLPYTKAFFGWRNLTDKQTNIAFHGINHFFRGLDRTRMDREIDESRALEDFDLFLKDMNLLGLENEIVWTVDIYLNLKRGQPEKAVSALEKLGKSKLCDENEREVVSKTIQYIKDRKKSDKLNTIYDKAFMTKVASKYIISILAKIDWEEILHNNNVPYTKQLFTSINKFKQISSTVDHYKQSPVSDSNTEKIRKKGNEIMDKAKSLW